MLLHHGNILQETLGDLFGAQPHEYDPKFSSGVVSLPPPRKVPALANVQEHCRIIPNTHNLYRPVAVGYTRFLPRPKMGNRALFLVQFVSLVVCWQLYRKMVLVRIGSNLMERCAITLQSPD